MKREAISKTKNLDAVIGAPQSTADFLGSVLVENLNRLEKTVYKKLCSGFEKTLEEAVLVIFDALYESKELYFCGCKKTQHPPFCDGSHSKP